MKKAGKNKVGKVPNFNPALCRLTEVCRTEGKILRDFIKCADYSNYYKNEEHILRESFSDLTDFIWNEPCPVRR